MLDLQKSFKDTKGREWYLSPIPFDAYLRLKKGTYQLNLEDLIFLPTKQEQLGTATQPLAALVEDLERFVGVVYEIIRPQVERANLKQEDFTGALDGEVLMAMTDAFCQGVYDFFRCPRKRLILEDATKKGKAMIQTMEMRAKTEIPRTTELLIQKTNEAMDEALRKLASDTAPLQESVPSPIP